MTKIIGIYDLLETARETVSHLGEIGIDPDQLTIIGPELANRPGLKRAVLMGGATGLAASLLLPGNGHLMLAGYLTHQVTLHTVGLSTAKALASGAVAGGTIDLLRRIGLDRRAVREAADAISRGQYALALRGDWMTLQRAHDLIGRHSGEPDARLLDLVSRYGYEHQSFLCLYGGMKVWYSDEPEAAVVYRQVGRVALVTGAPLASRENLRDVTLKFLEYCRGNDLDCLMLPVGEEFASIARECGMALLGVGESGYFKFPDWRPAGDKAKKIRSGVNQATKAGIRVEPYDPGHNQDSTVRAEIEKLCQAWIDTREVDALGWLLELDPFHLSEHKRYFLARNSEGRLEGLLACAPIPARNGWYLEDLIRRADAERGVSELLVVEALRHLAADGATMATLATSPLAGIDPGKLEGQFKQLARVLVLIYEHLDAFYHFKPLHRFKAKFAPSFVESEYLAVYPPRIRPRMIYGVMGAFDPAGFTGVLTSKARRLWQQRRRTPDQPNQVESAA